MPLINESSDAIPIKIKLLYPQSKMPERQHPGDIGWDLYAAGQFYVWTEEVTLVKTGIAIELPPGYEAQVRCRSGLALKHGIFSVNGIGTIDQEYRGEIGVILSRVGSGPWPYIIYPGDKIAQMVIKRVPDVCLMAVTELTDTVRGVKGYGSTGR